MKDHLKIIFVLILVASIFWVNSFVRRSMREMDDSTAFQKAAGVAAPIAKAVKPQQDEVPQPQMTGEITRENRVIPGDDYEESVFYQGGKEIARQKIVHGKIMEQVGQIPDGKVHVEDQYLQTSGDEYYENGKRNGVSRAYYEGGMLRRETTYVDGKEMTVKEYFNTGAVHFVEDYRNALDVPGETEVGEGRIYFPDGKLRYEWNLTKGNRHGFKRAYNQLGELVMEINYDEKGQVVK